MCSSQFTQEEKELLLEVLEQVIWDCVASYTSELGWKKKARKDELEYWKRRADLADSILKKSGLDGVSTEFPEDTKDN